MTGFEIFLCVVAGIFAFLLLTISIPVRVTIGYDRQFHLSVRYLFISHTFFPTDPNKKKKEKPKKEKKPKEEKPEEEKPKEKKLNPVVEMVKANGYDGIVSVIENLGRVLKKYAVNLMKSIVFEEIDVNIAVGTGDAASTAIKYGQTCQQVFPVMGYICSNYLVKKYDVNVEPDFLANKTQGEFFCDMKVNVRKISNSTIGMLMRLVFGVVVKFVLGGLKKTDKSSNKSSENQPSKVK